VHVCAQSARIKSWQKNETHHDMFDCSQQLVLFVWQFSSYEEALSTEKILVASFSLFLHYHITAKMQQ
jgi:hypothetical protein